MKSKEVTVALKTGLHARPAALFVQEANRFISDVQVEKGEKKVNAKSIMGIMSLAINHGTAIRIIVDGPDEDQAIERLAEIVTRAE